MPLPASISLSSAGLRLLCCTSTLSSRQVWLQASSFFVPTWRAIISLSVIIIAYFSNYMLQLWKPVDILPLSLFCPFIKAKHYWVDIANLLYAKIGFNLALCVFWDDYINRSLFDADLLISPFFDLYHNVLPTVVDERKYSSPLSSCLYPL